MPRYAYSRFFAIVIVVIALGYSLLFLFDSFDADREILGQPLNVTDVVVNHLTYKKMQPSSVYSHSQKSVSVVRASVNSDRLILGSTLSVESIKVGEPVDADGEVSNVTSPNVSINIGEPLDADGEVSNVTSPNVSINIGEPVDADSMVTNITTSHMPVNIGEPVDADGVLDSTTSPSIPVMIGDPIDAGNPNNAYYFSN
jgi:hypothetical protein